jgi:hypothetical protein
MLNSSWKRLGFAFGFVAALLGVYTVAYYVMVVPRQVESIRKGPGENLVTRSVRPVYCCGEELSKSFFLPIQWVDTKIRPHVWNWPLDDQH